MLGQPPQCQALHFPAVARVDQAADPHPLPGAGQAVTVEQIEQQRNGTPQQRHGGPARPRQRRKDLVLPRLVHVRSVRGTEHHRLCLHGECIHRST